MMPVQTFVINVKLGLNFLGLSSQLALRRWPNVGPTSALTWGQRRHTNVGPTWICQLAQRWYTNVRPTFVCQHWPNVNVATLIQIQCPALTDTILQILFPTCIALWCFCCPFWLWGVHWMDACLNGLINGIYLDNVMIWKCFLRYWALYY